MILKPFRGLRPTPAATEALVSPPYDVIDRAEARALASGKPQSFLYVVRPEVALDEGVSLYDDAVYAAAQNGLQRLISEGALARDERPAFYLYQQRWRGHVQTGIVGAAAVDDYDEGRIKKHEHTRRQKEDDRARHVDATGANTGPVFLTYRATEELDTIVEMLTTEPAMVEVTQAEVEHLLWPIFDEVQLTKIEAAFTKIEEAYVADGHHRSASASRTRALRAERNSVHTGAEDYNRFLAVLFPDNQLQILPYNRLIRDLNGESVEGFLDKLREDFSLSECDGGEVSSRGGVHFYLAGRWYRLALRDEGADDPVKSLDVSRLQEQILAPILGIGDPRSDERISFVGGIRGTAALERAVDERRAAIAFSLYPTSIDELLQVADSGEVMPPKSTWFEPKLLSGLVTHLLDGPPPERP
ncbi:MAG: DUF1015 family protein, partial [Myxococcota bacterium]|nr:DUF1015 family protein [Myxococcota bacterium]